MKPSKSATVTSAGSFKIRSDALFAFCVWTDSRALRARSTLPATMPPMKSFLALLLKDVLDRETSEVRDFTSI